MAPRFAELGHTLPRYRIAIGFPSTGSKGKRIGECWDAAASADGTHEILIRPDVADPLDVAAVLAHELAHAAVGIAAGHGRPFAKVAKAIGLEGSMKATVPGEVFKHFVAPILEAAGPLPHARLAGGESTGPKKQTARLLKAECPECGYTVRLAKKWVVEKGAPLCPEHLSPLVVEGLEEEPEEDEAGVEAPRLAACRG
ncbi:MAG: SprT-like domain-containing protein [Alphaproteobacteria bacterium]|nr:SprT-like domain-containing protein [Alphaproteobacteria bacterium]MBF0395049.1 SprT-like domain-containing protein [Alphaproteobacteria bacterium]